jgi:hypothetical protein
MGEKQITGSPPISGGVGPTHASRTKLVVTVVPVLPIEDV